MISEQVNYLARRAKVKALTLSIRRRKKRRKAMIKHPLTKLMRKSRMDQRMACYQTKTSLIASLIFSSARVKPYGSRARMDCSLP